MNTVTVKFNGRDIVCRALRIGHELWLHFDGSTHVVDLRPKQKGNTRSDAEASGDILAPMPGKILNVYCAPGDEVLAKTALVTMEAMKMEYTLTAKFNGVVERVLVKNGDQVQLNQLLVHVEKK